MIIILVKYFCKDNCREKFLNAIKENKIDVLSRNESGNIQYEYSCSVEDENVLILNEIWKDSESVKLHNSAEHFKLLGEIKAEYVHSADIQKFKSEKADI